MGRRLPNALSDIASLSVDPRPFLTQSRHSRPSAAAATIPAPSAKMVPVVCWGQNDHRQASPPLGKTFRLINSGASHTCGLETNGTLICWGALGDRRVPQMGTFAELSTEGGFTQCFITESGHGVCRGNDFYGQARPSFEEQFIAMSGGGRHVCGLRQDGSVRCWGDDDYGQTTPPKGERFIAISVGPRTRADCVRTGSFYAGDVSRTANRRPRSGERFMSISSGWMHACGLRAGLTAPIAHRLTMVLINPFTREQRTETGFVLKCPRTHLSRIEPRTIESP